MEQIYQLYYCIDSSPAFLSSFSCLFLLSHAISSASSSSSSFPSSPTSFFFLTFYFSLSSVEIGFKILPKLSKWFTSDLQSSALFAHVQVKSLKTSSLFFRIKRKLEVCMFVFRFIIWSHLILFIYSFWMLVLLIICSIKVIYKIAHLKYVYFMLARLSFVLFKFIYFHLKTYYLLNSRLHAWCWKLLRMRGNDYFALEFSA